MTSALHTNRDTVAGVGGTDAQHARLAMGGLLAVQGPTALDVRTGVLHGPGSTTLVTGTAATGPMTVSIAPHHWETSRGSANGGYLGVLPAATTPTIGAAPATGQRIDVVYVKQQDKTAGVPSPDATSAPLYGVLAGPADGTKPSLSTIAGAEELATVTVLPGATATNGANVTIANTARQTVARGAPVPCRTVAERDAITKFVGLTVKRLDDGGRAERWTGSRWAPVSTADATLGDSHLTANLLLPDPATWADVATVVGTSSGGLCVARWSGAAFNGASGVDRQMSWRVLCDAADIGSFLGIAIPLTGAPRVPRFAAFSSTPAAGVHTWKLQAQASAASSVFAETALLTVIERG